MIFTDDQRALLSKQWKDIEQGIIVDSDHEYNLQWGTLREKFYKENGPIPCSRIDTERLSTLKDIFKGERIFILGNEPSLNNGPLELLKDEFTFGINDIYLLFDKIAWRPTFYTINDWQVVPDIANKINLLTGMTFFFEERFKGLLRGDDEEVYWYTHTSDPRERTFVHDITKGVLDTGSTTGTAIQIAFYMGFNPIYLVGCDLEYELSETVNYENPSKFGSDTELYLTSTENDDPGHFDKSYSGKSRQWYNHHSKITIESYMQCKEGIEKAGGKIFNATIGSELTIYEDVDFKSLFPRPKHMMGKQLIDKIRKPIEIISPTPEPWIENYLLGPFARCENANINEIRIVFNTLQHTEAGVMVDVGAHHGSSLLPFAKNGWRVYAFEPNSENRSILATNVSTFRNVSVDKRVVSDTTESSVPFYSSSGSSSTNFLKPFSKSHRHNGTVDTVTLTDFCSERKLSHISLLKIDAGRSNLIVLKSVPWDNIKPKVIICKFEDSKIRSLGYAMYDIARYLVERGYKVLVSEWHPIIGHSIRRDWHRLVHYPCELNDRNAWGNLIAFREQPDFAKIAATARNIVNVDTERTELRDRGLYRRIMDYLKNYPTIMIIGRFLKWSITKFKRNLFGVGGIFISIIIALYIAGALVEPVRWYLVGIASALLLLGSGILVLSYVRLLLNRFIKEQPLTMETIPANINRDFPARFNEQLDEREKHTQWRTIKNLYKGKRVFIIGNGPSLNRTPLHLLQNEYTLCFNRFNLMFERLNWRPTMYMCADHRVAEDTASQINVIVPFVSYAFFPDKHPAGPDFRNFIEDAHNVFWLSASNRGFHDDLPRCGLGGTVTHVGLQVLAFMGFSPIYLIGVDMNYKDHTSAVKHDKWHWTSTRDDDPNHFDPRYFGTGTKYHYPTLHEDMLPSLQRAKEHLEEKGIRVLNAGIGGSLEIFPRVDFRSLFNIKEDMEVEMLLSAVPSELQQDALKVLRSGKAIEMQADWHENAPFQATTLQLAEQLIPKTIFTHIPYGPFGNRYLFVRRENVSSASATKPKK